MGLDVIPQYRCVILLTLFIFERLVAVKQRQVTRSQPEAAIQEETNAQDEWRSVNYRSTPGNSRLIILTFLAQGTIAVALSGNVLLAG